jgi:hypothetical protein
MGWLDLAPHGVESRPVGPDPAREGCQARGRRPENEGEGKVCCSTLVSVRLVKCGSLRGVLWIGARLEF